MIDQRAYQETVIYCFGCGVESPARGRQGHLRKWCSPRCGAKENTRLLNARDPDYQWRYSLLRGTDDRDPMTNQQYEAMLQVQNGHCALCPAITFRTSRPTRHLGVDHNRETKKIRGLLCDSCNRIVGHIESQIRKGRLDAILAYLNREVK